MASGVDKPELVITSSRGDRGEWQRQHVNAILVFVAGIADVSACRVERHDVATSGAVDERQITQGAVGECSGEVVLLRHGGCFDRHGAGGGTIRD